LEAAVKRTPPPNAENTAMAFRLQRERGKLNTYTLKLSGAGNPLAQCWPYCGGANREELFYFWF
jgi:hypothetical protein